MIDIAARTPLDGTHSRRKRRGWLAALALLVIGAGAFSAWGWLQGSIGTVTLRPHCTATALGSSTDLGPEEAGNAATIAAIAVRRGLPGRAATIGIATAIQESKLINVEYGDRDSLGLFQQRPSQGWGTAAQVRDPVYAANAFFDVLVKIEGYENLPITKAAQKVQRSAFPSAYADHEPQARIFASALSGYSTGALTCVLDEVKASGSSAARAAAVRSAAEQETGRKGIVVERDGTAVRFALAGREGARLGWALAQWAVSRADALDIVAVEVDGKQWQRDEPREGWTTLSGGPPAGTVIVRVAPAT